jgi:hypothetical protein
MPAIKYTFIADGVQTVRDGFRSIADDAKDASKAIDSGMRAVRQGVRAAGKEMSASEKFAKDLAAAAKKAEAEDRKRAIEEAKAARKAAQEQERAQKHVAGIRDRHFREQQKVDEKATAQRRKEIVKGLADKRAHEEKLHEIARKGKERDLANERKHADRMAAFKRDTAAKTNAATARDLAKDQATEQGRQFNKLLRQKQYDEAFKKRRESLAEKRSDELKSSVRGAFIGGSAAIVAGSLGIAGSAARQSLQLQEVSNRLSIAARGAGEEAVDPRELRKEFEATAAKTPGIAAIDVANAVSQFVSKTGELGVARKSQGVFATVASATGSSIEDVSAAAADLFQKFDITSVEGMADAMSALAFQGKAGSFELKDAASQFAKLSAAASRFGLAKGAGGVRTLGGLTQIARSATGSPEQAATAVEAMFRQFTSAPALKQLKTIGVDPFKDKGRTQTKEIRGLLVETIAKSKGDLAKLQGIFGEEGIRAISPIISEFNNAKQAASVGGASAADSNQAGADAARDYINKMIDAPGDFSELQKDAAQAQQDASAKMTAAWEKITAGISDAAVPAIAELVKTIEESPGAIEALVGTIENLIYFFSALIGAVQDVMEWMGIATKKTKSPEEQRELAKKKVETLQNQLDRFDKKRGGSREQVMQLLEESQTLDKKGDKKGAREKLLQANAMNAKLDATKEMDDERNAIAGKLNAAKKEATAADTQVKAAQDQKHRIRSTDQFAKEYEALLDPSQRDNKEFARTVASNLRTVEGTQSLQDDTLMRGETEAARDFRINQAKEREASAGLQMYGQEKSGENMSAAMAKVEAAAKALEGAAGAIQKQGQASIVPPP